VYSVVYSVEGHVLCSTDTAACRVRTVSQPYVCLSTVR
jgi:hypothetical protein